MFISPAKTRAIKKALAFLAVSFAVLSASLPLAASAHVLETDGSVGVVLHVDPDDDPYVGQPTGIYFDVKDKSGKFSLANCDCIADFADKNGVIASAVVSGEAVQFTAPTKGVYTITLHGQPLARAAGAFQEFKISFDVRFARTASSSSIASAAQPEHQSSTSSTIGHHIAEHFIHYIVFGLGFGIAIYIYIRDGLRLRKKRRAEQKAKGAADKESDDQTPPRSSTLVVALIALTALTFSLTYGFHCQTYTHNLASVDHACCLQPQVLAAAQPELGLTIVLQSTPSENILSAEPLRVVSKANKSPPVRV